MFYEIWLSAKYLQSKKKHGAISLVTFLSVIGVAVGVMALIVVLSVINGFTKGLMEKILGLTPHVVVFQRGQEMPAYEEVRGQLMKVEGVKAASPFIVREVILQSASKSIQVMVRAIDPLLANTIAPLAGIVRGGSIQELLENKRGDPIPIVVGRGVLKDLKVGVGEYVVLVSPEGTLTPWGNLPKWKKVKVAGFFDAGYWEFDSRVVLMSLAAAQQLFEIQGRVTGIDLRVADPYQAPEVRKRIQESQLGNNYLAQDWTQTNRSLMVALATQKRVIFIILLCIVGVAALLIISILVMTVIEKKKDIAILKAMGARSWSVMRLFAMHGLMISLTGTFLGCLGGVLISWNLEWIVRFVEKTFRVNFLPEEVYYIGQLTARVEPLDLAIIVATTLGISALASLYPSWKAASMDPVEILRYE